MPDAYVTSATIKNGKIQLSVLVSDFKPGEYVEISGQATQTGGAFANFYDIQQVPLQPNGDPNDSTDSDNYYIDVTGGPTPHQFRKDEDVSAVARVGVLWLTVLEGQSSSPGMGVAEEGTTWIKKIVSQVNAASW